MLQQSMEQSKRQVSWERYICVPDDDLTSLHLSFLSLSCHDQDHERWFLLHGDDSLPLARH